MPDPKKQNQPKLNPYQEFLAQHEEILRHKWIRSEESGTDIGFEHALVNWIKTERDNWRKSRQS